MGTTEIKVSGAYGVVHRHDGYGYWHWANERHVGAFGSLAHATHAAVNAKAPKGWVAFKEANPTAWDEYVAGLAGASHPAQVAWVAAAKAKAKAKGRVAKAKAPTPADAAYLDDLGASAKANLANLAYLAQV